ncbi:MAG: hypothetical protein AB8F94_24660 [Saprospiraceae bacterium]
MYVNFFEEELNWVLDDPILRIYYESTECGEWGGHEEHIKVLRNNTKKYKLEYEKYQVDCDTMIKVFDGIGYLTRPLSTLINKKEIEVNQNEKEAILDFLFDMVKSKFEEEGIVSHSEIKLSISNSDSTFYIWKYGGNADDYHKLLKRLRIH